MSIPFKPIERGQPGVVGGGEKKFYASPELSGTIDLDGVTSRIEKISTMSGGDIRGVLYTMVDVIVQELAEGRSVRMGDLGSLRVSFSSEGHATADEVSATSVKSTRVIFSPGKRIRNMLGNLSFRKAN